MIEPEQISRSAIKRPKVGYIHFTKINELSQLHLMTMHLINLAEYGAVLSTRERGREAADVLQRALEDGGVVLNFAGIEVASPSYLDEILTRLRGLLAENTSAIVVVVEINRDVKESLELVLERRKMALAVLKDDTIELLGGRRQLAETLAAASELGTFKATELADRLELKLPNLHQRLKALGEAGAVARTVDHTATRGRRYDYEAPDPKALDPKKLKKAKNVVVA
jgi:DNA-binding transcriptional ArsR family regulator